MIAVTSLILDICYISKQTFSSKELYAAYATVLGFRVILLPIMIIIKNICYKICQKD